MWEDLSLGLLSDSSLDLTRYPSHFDKEILCSDVLVLLPMHCPEFTPYTPKSLYNSLLETCRSLSQSSSIIIPVESWHLLELESHVLSAATAFELPVLCLSSTAQAYFSYAAGSTD